MEPLGEATALIERIEKGIALSRECSFAGIEDELRNRLREVLMIVTLIEAVTDGTEREQAAAMLVRIEAALETAQ